MTLNYKKWSLLWSIFPEHLFPTKNFLRQNLHTCQVLVEIVDHIIALVINVVLVGFRLFLVVEQFDFMALFPPPTRPGFFLTILI